MHKAALYANNNFLPKYTAIKCLDEFGHKLQWNPSGARVLDIGSADGAVTDILKKYMPSNYKRLVGCDISEKMVNFANEHYADSRTEFHVLDIQGKLPEEFRESFDHIVSFTTLHWVRNQEAAFRNMYEMLADNGDCLHLIMGPTELLDAYRLIRLESKWTEWTKDVPFVGPYQDSTEPEKEITDMLEKIGYKNVEVKCVQNEFVFDDKIKWRNTIESVDPFVIPKEKFDDYLEDLTRLMRKVNREHNIETKKDTFITMSYKSIIVYARK